MFMDWDKLEAVSFYAKKKKKRFVSGFPTDPFFSAPTLNFFFNFQKKIENKRRKMAKKSSKSVERFKSYKKLQK